MSGTNEVARNLLAQEPGRVDCYTDAANTRIIPRHKPACYDGGTAYIVKTTDRDTLPIVVSACLHRLTETQAIAALIWGAVS